MKELRVVLFLLMALCVMALCSAGLAETLTLPGDLTAVEEQAFYGDGSLDAVVLPEGLRTIGNKAFADSGVKAVNLPDSLTLIADDAFDGTVIDTLTVNEGTYAYSWAVSHGYFGWTWEELLDGTVEITGYTHALSDVSIPSVIRGKQVSAIADKAFAGSNGLKNVTVPGTITRIGNAAFAGIFSLQTVTVEQGVRTIGSEAFTDCPNLTSVTLPESGATLGDKLFRYCVVLETVTLPQGIPAIPFQCFWQCESLQSIAVPEGVTAIQDGAFYMCLALKAFTGPEGLVSIGRNAFNQCENLENVTLPATVTSIDETAFNNSKFAVMIAPEGSVAAQYGTAHGMIPENVVLECPHPYTDWGTWEHTGPEDAAALKVTFSARTYFGPELIQDFLTVTDAEGGERDYYGYDLAGKTLVLPGNRFSLDLYCRPGGNDLFGFRITDITPLSAADYQAYLNELALNPWVSSVEHGVLEITEYRGRDTDLTIPAHINGAPVGSIGERAFRGNHMLTRVTVEAGIARLGNGVFQDCKNLTEVILPETITDMGEYVFLGCESLTDVVFPQSLTTIPQETFSGCIALPSFVLSENVTSIGAYAFSECEALESFVIPDRVTEVGRRAFTESGLRSLVIGNGITETPEQICQYCESLTSVTLPETLTAIGFGSFAECTSLSQITLPAGLKTIDAYAFDQCPLTELTLPEGLETIGGEALKECAMTRIVMPNSLISLHFSALSGAENLTEIVFADDHPVYMFRNGCVIDKTDGTLLFTLYSTQGALQLPEGVTRIGDGALSYCRISDVVLPASVESIGNSLFEGDNELTRAVIEAPITKLPNYTFYECWSLTEVVLPDTITRIGDLALAETPLRTLDLPPNLKSIGIGAFKECGELETLVLPEGLEEIAYNAIIKCPKLVSVTIPASVQIIGVYNFSGCDQVVIHAPAGSYAAQWARDNGIPVVTE